MLGELPFHDITSKIVPDMNAVTTDVRAAWRPALKSEEVRTRIFEHPALGYWALSELLVAADEDSDADPICESMTAALKTVVAADIDRIVTLAGLVWHADQLARLVSSGAVPVSGPGWTRDDVRAALSERSRSKAPDVEEAAFADAVVASGEACLSAWLGTVPAVVRRALKISDGRLGQLYRMNKTSDDKAQVVQSLLVNLESAS